MKTILKVIFFIFFLTTSLLSINIFGQGQTFFLKEYWDSVKVCENPHKGWYHHYYDDGSFQFQIQSDEDIDSFPGLDYMYLRMHWSLLEPEEGKFDWSMIDNCVKKWVPKGYRLVIGVCTKQNLLYGTPKWVVDAGAKGKIINNKWCPVYGDSIFMVKLQAFHKALAARYDGKPWLAFVDIKSIGTWGEGHEVDGGFQPTTAVIKKHIDMYLEYYPKTKLIVSDDIAYYDRTREQGDTISRYIESKGISWHDDTPLVAPFVIWNASTFSVVRPWLYAETYRNRPVILEAQYYDIVRSDGNWIIPEGTKGPNGVSGADFLRGAIRVMHASYIGYQADAGQWRRENPNLARELANKCGYWYFPKSFTVPEHLMPGSSGSWNLEWENHGVAPAYNLYILEMKLDGPSKHLVTLTESDNRRWYENQSTVENYNINIPSSIKPGKYKVCFRLRDPLTGRNVELAMKNSIRDAQGFYLFGNVTIYDYEYAPVTRVEVYPRSTTLNINATQQLSATILPLNANNKNISWSSSDSLVATVSSSGFVTGVKVGEATIIVKSQDGNKTVSCLVRVSNSYDLIITDLTWTPAIPIRGDEVTFIATIKNIGGMATPDRGAYPDGVSHGVVFCVNDTVVSWTEKYINSLAPNASVFLTPSWDVKWTAGMNGNYKVEAFIGDANQVSGKREGNKSLIRNLCVGCRSDLK
jgi:hypothetical protein